MKKSRFLRRILWTVLVLFILMNVVAYMHAYKFTHFASSIKVKTADPKKLSLAAKIKTLFLGVDNPRPQSIDSPHQKFETIRLKSNKEIECWSIKNDSAKGTVIIFHGFAGDKSTMLDKSDEFILLGYNTLLVDFMGSGGSEGNQTTIGFKEAEEVQSCFEYVKKSGEKNIYLFGTSMGAAAILRSLYKYNIDPSGIIIECPFGSLYKTTCARFKNMGIPSFPMASLLVFWGGVQNGFSGFSLNPEKYATAVHCPTLLLYGEKDDKVSRTEIDNIYKNLGGKKTLTTFADAGHENYFKKYKAEWTDAVSSFLK